MLERLLLFVSPVVWWFNLLDGIVAIIWLAIKGGHWWDIILAFGVAWAGSWILSLLLLPTLVLLPFEKWAERRRGRTYVLGFISNSYTMSVLGLWCVVIMAYFYDRGSPDSNIPMLMLGYSSATGAFQFLASKERDNEFTMLSSGVATMGAFVTFLLILENLLALVIPTWLLLVIAESHVASTWTIRRFPDGSFEG